MNGGLERAIEISLGLGAAEQWNARDYQGAGRTIATAVREHYHVQKMSGLDGEKVSYIDWGGKVVTRPATVDFGYGIHRRVPAYGIRRAIFDAAFGYVNGFPARAILYYVITRDFSERFMRRTLRREGASYWWTYSSTAMGYDNGREERQRVDPEWIKEQREQGWPDVHPETFCHRCGERNMPWCANREDWVTATTAWAAETGREGICCPRCFADMFREQTGTDPTWVLTQWRGDWSLHEPPADAAATSGSL
ncbi:MAG: hypothetical protein JWP32_2863 [Schumannella sp.]|nr:hypothetical protein [Schumannella sp.]